MLNCKQVSQLVSESIDRKLPLWTRLNLWMHLAMCGLCARFRKAMLRVQHEARNYAAEIENDERDQDVTLAPEAKHRIRSAIDRDRPSS